MAKIKKEEKPSVEIIQHKEEPKEIAIVNTGIGLNSKGVILKTYDDLAKFSDVVFKSGLAPKSFTSPQAVMIAVQLGAEIGLTPMMSIQNIAVINGIPSIYGDAMKALVLSSNECEYVREYFEGTPYHDDFAAVCVSKRKGQQETIEKFSVADAKKAGLWNKEGTWQKYPKRMLKFRARGFNLRDNYSDLLKGLRSVEETNDFSISDSYTNSNNTTVKKSGATKMRETMGQMPPDDETEYEEVK
jgi:hypothetical protein